MTVKFDMVNAEANFNTVVTQLQKLPGLDRKAIIRGEAGSILKRCVAKTPVATPEKVTLEARQRILSKMLLTRGGSSSGGSGITVNVGKRGPFGRVFIKTTSKFAKGKYRRTHDENFQPLNQHYKDSVWANLSSKISTAKATLARAVPDAIKASGLARQSWILVARALQIDLARVSGGGISAKALGDAEKARGKHGRAYPNGTASEEVSTDSYYVTLINRYPYGQRLRFAGILQAAIAGRVKYIATTLEKGIFDSASQVLKKFPGWTIK